MANGVRYSGPSLAAGAISKAISDMFEGLLQGERGGLDAEQKLREQGLAEREMGMKVASFPSELAHLRAQTALAGESAKKTAAETGRLWLLTPAERRLTEAEADKSGAQTRLYGAQTDELSIGQWHRKRAQDDWARVQEKAASEGRDVTREERRAFLARNPFIAGTSQIPVADLLEMGALEAMLQAQGDPYKGPKTLLEISQEGAKQAEAVIKDIFGEQSQKPLAADTRRWLTAAFTNSLILGTGFPGAEQFVANPGIAPKPLFDYIVSQLQVELPGLPYEHYTGMADEILKMVGSGAATWQSVLPAVTKALGAKPQPGKSPVNAPPPKRGYGAPGAGPGPVDQEYDESTGQYTR